MQNKLHKSKYSENPEITFLYKKWKEYLRIVGKDINKKPIDFVLFAVANKYMESKRVKKKR